MPLWAYLSLVGFALVSMGVYGHWPYYGHPDPKELEMPFLSGMVGFLFVAAFFLLPVVPLFIGAKVFVSWKAGWKESLGWVWASLVLYLAGVVLVVWDIQFFGLINWMLD
ncbi:hypothetical protein JIN87_21410 [Pelagicoccus mobilis]|uniref:Uncharacterized protein n=2 Tax=Pelagicoccus mobilis TaxID=415221 RepID=A0A934VT87_9BACT|nr:hypothetical protein [Pelagicoccus mobilis]